MFGWVQSNRATNSCTVWLSLFSALSIFRRVGSLSAWKHPATSSSSESGSCEKSVAFVIDTYVYKHIFMQLSSPFFQFLSGGNRMEKVRMRQIALLAFSGLLVLLAGACSHTPERDKTNSAAVRQVRTAVVTRSTGGSVEAIMGSVVARNRADIQTKIQARIEQISVVMGSYVRKGEPLAELDTREIRARVQQARAVSEQTSAELGRYDSMLAQRMISQQDYDAVRARATVAEAGLRESEAMLSYARIEAPFSGRVTQKLVDIGDLAVPGRPLFTLEEDAAPRFVVNLPESRGGQLSVGDSLRVEIPSIDTIIRGRVEELSPSAEPSSRTYMVRIVLDAHARVRPGQFGRLLLSVGSEESLLIPDLALVRRGQLELVYVASADSVAKLRLVRTGRKLPQGYEILAGLSAGEKVIISDPASLSDGDRIEGQL